MTRTSSALVKVAVSLPLQGLNVADVRPILEVLIFREGK